MPDDAIPLPLFERPPDAAADAAPTARMPSGLADPAGPQSVETPPPPAGCGRLVRLAWPLLSLLSRIVAGRGASRSESLKSEVTALMHDFERAALADGISARDVSAARYVLCTAIDEAALTSAWGTSAGWNDASLLSLFHNETWGGEKVFTLIARALDDRGQYLDLLELCHFVMLLGFQGKFRLERDGSAQADALRRRLFDVLRPRLAPPAQLPMPQPEPVHRRGRLIRYAPVWAVGAVCLLLAFTLFAWYDYQLNGQATQVAALFHGIAFPAGPQAGQ